MVEVNTSTRTLQSAPPSWHSLLLMLVVGCSCLISLPAVISSIDSATTKTSITSPLFEDFISQQSLGWIRIAFAILCLLITIWSIQNPPLILTVQYSKESKLRKSPFSLGGLKKQLFFTNITWILLGISCGLNGSLALFDHHDMHTQWLDGNKWIYRVALWLFEVVAPNSLLVSFVVRYAIWPNAIKNGVPTDNMKKPVALFMHNANLLISLTEAGLLGKIPVRLTDIPIGTLYQLLYVLMIWSMTNHWHPSGEPQFLYFFFDTTVGFTTTIAMAILLLFSLIFSVLFSFLDTILGYLNQNIFAHALFIIVVFSTMSRFRD